MTIGLLEDTRTVVDVDDDNLELPTVASRLLTRAQRRNLREWVAALRSGEYRQARRALCNGDGEMCCLGVACDVVGPGWWHREDEIFKNLDWTYVDSGGLDRYDEIVCDGSIYDWNDASLTPKMLETLGLTNAEENHLIGMNDNNEASFEEIATWVETRFNLKRA